MSLKIIAADFGCTGTNSTQASLNQLGYPFYYMFEVIENKVNAGHLDFWRKVANAPDVKQHDCPEVFAKYTATVDNRGIEGEMECTVEAIWAGGGQIHRMAAFLQALLQISRHHGIILDEQYMHAGYVSYS